MHDILLIDKFKDDSVKYDILVIGGGPAVVAALRARPAKA
jgi:hypothetical protein